MRATVNEDAMDVCMGTEIVKKVGRSYEKGFYAVVVVNCRKREIVRKLLDVHG